MTHKPITFASVKVYCLITLICPIILISHIAQLLLTVSFIVPVKVRIFPLNMHDIIIYVARWWEKYLSKRNPLKHPCSWRDKLIVLRIFYFMDRIWKMLEKKKNLPIDKQAYLILLFDIFYWVYRFCIVYIESKCFIDPLYFS